MVCRLINGFELHCNMIKGGIGGARTLTGLKFEKRIDLKTAITRIKGYSIKDNIVFFKEQKVAQLFKKNALYKQFLEPKCIDYSKIISKRLLPDDAILVFGKNTLYIVEMKFQAVPGSVDEKLQTCDFKNKQYQKLLSPLNIKVEYVYVLNDWFQKKEYIDVLNYITAVGCKHFFSEIPLSYLGLPSASV